MRKISYGIGLFCAAFLLAFGFYASYRHASHGDTPTPKSIETENSMTPVYHIRIADGRVVVFLDNGSIYETTDITWDMLPSSVQAGILKGYTLKSKQELYSFLENYSS